MLVSLASKNQTFPYITFIRRLNFSAIADHMTDPILLRLVNCSRLERLTLSGCDSITDDSIIKILKNSNELVALDLSDCKLVTDQCICAVGQYSKLLQGLNLSGCKTITDLGLQSLRHCKALRRLKLKFCEKITDAALITIAVACPLLLEVDLVGCKLVTNASLWMLWKHSSHLRELSLSGCTEISDGGFPSFSNSTIAADGIPHPILQEPIGQDSQNQINGSSYQDLDHHFNKYDSAMLIDHLDGSAHEFLSSLTSNRRLDNSLMHFDHIRFLDLTSLVKLTDASLEGIIKHMPRIRNLVLAKCVGLTDESLNSICGLGKYLHYLHLGHVSSLTDRAVIRVARSCTRLRYIDLACCNNLTDMSVFELAQCLPRLKRIGLVRVTNITDQSVYTLVERTSLERIHLSYCDNITVGAIHWLLQRLHRLTHLSLTGVPAFRRTDLQAWCRAPPKDFNAHQRQAFCVYSGKGVNELRYYLAALYASSSASLGRSLQSTNFTNGLVDEENTNNLTTTAAPVGLNLAVFNSMPDPRVMAAAMAAARQKTNPQLYSLGNRRRELRLPERASRVALSDVLYEGPTGSLSSSMISGNGQLLSIPGQPRLATRRHIQSNRNGDAEGITHGSYSTGISSTEQLRDGQQPAMQIDESALGVTAAASQVSSNSIATGLNMTNRDEVPDQASSNGLNELHSPIPLYGSTNHKRQTSFGTDDRFLTDHNMINSTSSSLSTNQGPSRHGVGHIMKLDTSEGLQHNSSSGSLQNALRVPHYSIIRRRSDVDLAVAGSSHRRHLDGDGVQSGGEGMIIAEDYRSGSGNGIGVNGSMIRNSENGLNVDLPNRMDSVSPIEISDDERPPP